MGNRNGKFPKENEKKRRQSYTILQNSDQIVQDPQSGIAARSHEQDAYYSGKDGSRSIATANMRSSWEGNQSYIEQFQIQLQPEQSSVKFTNSELMNYELQHTQTDATDITLKEELPFELDTKILKVKELDKDKSPISPVFDKAEDNNKTYDSIEVTSKYSTIAADSETENVEESKFNVLADISAKRLTQTNPDFTEIKFYPHREYSTK